MVDVTHNYNENKWFLNSIYTLIKFILSKDLKVDIDRDIELRYLKNRSCIVLHGYIATVYDMTNYEYSKDSETEFIIKMFNDGETVHLIRNAIPKSEWYRYYKWFPEIAPSEPIANIDIDMQKVANRIFRIIKLLTNKNVTIESTKLNTDMGEYENEQIILNGTYNEIKFDARICRTLKMEYNTEQGEKLIWGRRVPGLPAEGS